MDIKAIETKMYQDLRRRISDEMGSSAEITLFYMLRSAKETAFVVGVIAFGKVLFGRGSVENEIVADLLRDLEWYYKGSAKKIELYHLNDPAPETDGAGGVQGSVSPYK